MKHADRSLALLFLLAFLLESPHGRSQDGTAAPLHTLSGQVVNNLTGEPIARALVQGGDAHAALTDRDGRFQLDKGTGEASTAVASKPGYFLKETFVLTKDASVTLHLIPEAIISGTVTDQNGQPIQDLQVQLKMLRVQNGFTRWVQLQNTPTNAEGEFRFAELEAGKYRVATGFHVEGLPEAASSIAFLPASYPPPTGDSENDALTLKPGDRVQANLDPSTGKLSLVTGSLNGMSGFGVAPEITTREGEMVNAPLSMLPSGEFRVRLPAGAYLLKFSFSRENQMFTGERDIQVGEAPLQGVVVSLAPRANIPVEVEYQSVAPAAQPGQSNPPGYLGLTLEQADATSLFRGFNGEPVPSNNGSEPARAMIFRNIEPGRYQLRVQNAAPWYVASATCANLDLLREPLVVAQNSGVCTLRILLRNDAASLKWSIAADDPTKPANERGYTPVIAIPLDTLAGNVQIANSYTMNDDSVASGTIDGLAPGHYLIMALRHQQELPYRDASAMARYLPLGKEVTLSRNGEANVVLRPIAGEP